MLVNKSQPDGATCPIDSGDQWTLWSERRPEDSRAEYRWRVPTRPILGMELRPEWTAKLHCCGMGYADNEWWPPFSHWDGYNRTVPPGTEWRPALPDEKDILWGGLNLLPSPHTGLPPKVEYHGRWIGAPPYQPEYLKLCSYLTGFNTWKNAANMEAAWNKRVPDPRVGDLLDALRDIAETGTRRHTERTGDMYSSDGYTDYEIVSPEAERAILALREYGDVT